MARSHDIDLKIMLPALRLLVFGNEPNSANSNTTPHAEVSARHRVGVRPKAVDLHLAQGGCAVPPVLIPEGGTKQQLVNDGPSLGTWF